MSVLITPLIGLAGEGVTFTWLQVEDTRQQGGHDDGGHHGHNMLQVLVVLGGPAL